MRRILGWICVCCLCGVSRLGWASTLLIRDGHAIPQATVVARENGQVRFRYADEEYIYVVGDSYLEAVTEEDPPNGYIVIHPSKLSPYMFVNSMPPASTAEAARPGVTVTPDSTESPMEQESAPATRPMKNAASLTADNVRRPFGYYLYGNLGYAGYTMADVNRWIINNNAVFKSLNVGLQNQIGGGFTFSGGLGFTLSEHWSVGVEFCSLAADSTNGNQAIGEHWALPAMEAGGFVSLGTYVAPDLHFSGLFNISSLFLTVAELHDYASGLGYGDRTLELSGSTTSFKAAAILEYRPDPHYGIGVQLAYRWAKIPEVHAAGSGLSGLLGNSNQTPLTVDYSGPYLVARVSLYFP